MSKDYNATVNLPKTDFPMRASLPKREPDMLKAWQEMDLYHKMVDRNIGKHDFILHDGPPFSNGMIHMGTSLNKCIKDIIVRYKNMTGWHAPYTPGWDNHGMPIESAIIKEQKLNHKAMSVSEFRDDCHDFAQHYVDVQREQFKRLGCQGDWDNPYLTMNPKFEAEEVKVFGEMFKKGYIYKGKKPVYWCPHDETALAEAEIEYADDPVTTIFVKFRVTDDKGKLSAFGPLDNIYFVIWTTTTWTLPGNQAICLNANVDYVVAKASNGEVYIMAEELIDSVLEQAGLTVAEKLAVMKGSEFEYMMTRHPLLEQSSMVILGDHVTTDAGTGCVHTAPAYGADDFMICGKYPEIETGADMVVNVGDDGRFNAAAGKYEGLDVLKAHPVIYQDLVDCGALLASEEIVHSYPHCWRCKSPIIFRATDQWFCSVEAFKEEAIKACDEVQWIPEWGHDRMVSMIRERADWCISRQRRWGLPIPVFYCADCGEPICNDETINRVSDIFREKGSNAWFDEEAEALLPAGYVCPHCGGKHFTKETNTLDGWFDSGSTHRAALEQDTGYWPATMYMEGGDQYRGWFQSSLLTAVATRGRAPYSIVLTHGWTVDGEGRAMHKSLGNGIYPDEVIPKYGADLVRLWAASTDYHMDVRCSDAIFKQLSDKYLKIRNTARYILGNLADFDPDKDSVATEDLLPLDRWAVVRLNELVRKCIDAYEAYDFYIATQAVHKFCVVDMSNFYLDVIKDRLYADKADGQSRRAAQTAIYMILDAMTRMIAPILAYTSDEIWSFMPHSDKEDASCVLYNEMPEPTGVQVDDAFISRWDRIHALRDDVQKALELARKEKKIGKSLEAKVELYCQGELYDFVKTVEQDLKTVFIVSEVEALNAGEGDYQGETEGFSVSVKHAHGEKCVRCWVYSDTVGQDAEHPQLCHRCASVVKGE